MMKQDKEIPKGYKDSPLGIIPEEWVVKRLGEICPVFKSGQGITSIDISKEGRYAVYGGNGLRGYTNSFTHSGRYVLIGRQGALCGNIILVDGNNYISEHAIAVQTNEKNYIGYWAYSLDYLSLNRLSESSAQPGLSVEKLVKYKVVIPPLAEQQKIAEILSTWDKAIEKQTALIEKLELRKRGLMQQLLTGKKRLEGFSGKWQKRNMKELFCIITKTNNNEKHAIMTISNKYGFMSQENKFDRVIAGDSLNKYTLLQKGDFAYNKGNSKTYPMGCIYKLSDVNSALVPFVYICFRPTIDIYSDFYKYYFINHGLDKQLNQIITSGARGDGLLNVNKEDFFSLTIPFPAFAEQAAIAHILTTTDKEIELARTKLTTLRSQKSGLMQQLLTGNKRINYINS